MYGFPIFHLPINNKNLHFGHNNSTRDAGRLHFPKLMIRYQIWRDLIIDNKFSDISLEI